MGDQVQRREADGGRPVPLLRWPCAKSKQEGIPPRVFRQIRRELIRADPAFRDPSRRVWVGLLLLVVLILTLLVMFSPGVAVRVGWLIPLLINAGILGWMIWSRRYVLDHPDAMVQDAWLRRGRCPACGYAWSALSSKAELEGTLICPECGATWAAVPKPSSSSSRPPPP
jgi:hypothetical protein